MPDTLAKTAPSAPPAPITRNVFDTFRHDMNDLFDRFTRGLPSLLSPNRAANLWTELDPFGPGFPVVDFWETETEYHVSAELPGLKESDIDLTMSGDTLFLKGEKKVESERKDKNFVCAERSYGSFQRSFYLPQGANPDAIEAKFENGILRVKIPKKPENIQAQKKIKIN